MKLSAIIILCILAAVLGGLLVGVLMPASTDRTEILNQRKLYEARLNALQREIQKTETHDAIWSKKVTELRDSLKVAHDQTQDFQTNLLNAKKIDLSHASAPELDHLVRLIVDRAKARHDD